MNDEMRTVPYSPGHPWYYVLGGPVPMPRQIFARVLADGYRGYLREEIRAADGRPEPSRSHGLRRLRRDEEGGRPSPHECSDVHANISLKYRHLCNGFAHLRRIDVLLSVQPDLFDP